MPSPGALYPSSTRPDVTTVANLAEEKLRQLQEEEKRNRTRIKLLDEEFEAKQAKVRDLATQEDERVAHLRALDEEILRQQHLVNRLSTQLDDRATKLPPLDDQIAAKRDALNALAAEQEEACRLLRKLDEEMAAKQRAMGALGDHSSDMADQQRVIAALLEEQRALQAEHEHCRRRLEDRVARASQAQTHFQLSQLQVDRQQVQLKMMEREQQQKREALERLQAKLEEAQSKYLEAQGDGLAVERAVARQRLELQLVEDETAAQKRILQDHLLQYARLEAELAGLKRKLRDAPPSEELEQRNAELRDQLTALKQEVTMARLAVETGDFKAQSLEVILAMQGQSESSQVLPLTTISAPHDDLVNLLHRQEDRVTQQQRDLVDKEGRIQMAETQTTQERELLGMIVAEFQVAEAELQMERAKVQRLHETCAQQDMKLSRYEPESDPAALPPAAPDSGAPHEAPTFTPPMRRAGWSPSAGSRPSFPSSKGRVGIRPTRQMASRWRASMSLDAGGITLYVS
eukprot:TRINITY_DN8749_c0_g1_i1.p1 TRINITY_DN8749_c0_g1~~TRINITY_DN8749_c0_g1_i1.p1  ORF type:complete len:533 (-),score=165.79 TRINITY_DN8749_c0_g1_i1:112-1665(-)